MPAKKRNARKTRRPNVLSFPLFFHLTIAGEYTTKLSSLREVFDRRRPFRVVSFSWEACSVSGKPVPLLQFKAYGPVSGADNVWSSRIHTIGPSVARGFYNIRNPLWYPSDTVTTTPIFAVALICISTGTTFDATLNISLRFELGPWEPDSACPKYVVVPLSLDFPSGSNV